MLQMGLSSNKKFYPKWNIDKLFWTFPFFFYLSHPRTIFLF